MQEDVVARASAAQYDENQIQVLEGLEAVRKRPGMYIATTSSRGLHHLVYEIVDNSIDEALAGFCSHIEVEILPGDVIRVTDNGRGIPVGKHPKMGIPTLEVVFTVLHAGGKFGGGGYKVSGGLHGVGASVVNALSEWLQVRVHKNGNIYEMKFARGNEVVETTKNDVLELLKENVRPEFLNRIDEVIMFTPLNKDEIRSIIGLQLDNIKRMLAANDMSMTVTDKAVDYICDKGYDTEFGARPVKRTIHRLILNQLSKEIIAQNIDKNSPIIIDADENGLKFSN